MSFAGAAGAIAAHSVIGRRPAPALSSQGTPMRAFGLAALVYLICLLTMFAGWITHIVVCIKAATLASYVFLLAGAVVFPVGAIHGIGCWFHWWG